MEAAMGIIMRDMEISEVNSVNQNITLIRRKTKPATERFA
jgi:hypothetical protein